MGFMPDEDAEQLSAYLSDFFEKQAPLSRTREWSDTESGYDAALWRRCATELGLQGLAIAGEFGGADAGLVNLGVAFEQLGRALVAAPFLSTVGLAASALAQLSGSSVAAELLSRIAAGDLVATLAWAGARPSTSQLRVEAGTLNGVADIVIDGDVAEAILVAARTGADGPGLFLVRPEAPGLIREPLVSLDSTRRLARLSFHDVPVEVLATDAEALLERTMDVATLLLAAEQLGGAQWVLDSAVDYARTRVQFGRPIGSFQAIKHRCADMLVDVELARSVVYHALSSAQRDPSTLPVEAALARSVVSEAFLTGAAASLQIHGGIGFTWEHSAHLYLKRAKSSALIFGDPIHHRRRLAEQLELTGVQS